MKGSSLSYKGHIVNIQVNMFKKEHLAQWHLTGDYDDHVILLQLPESSSFFLSYHSEV